MSDAPAEIDSIVLDALTPEAYSGRGYLAESFGAFFRDPTWFKRALVGMLLALVPIIGPMAVLGYSMMWMRETAWGLGEHMPTKPQAGQALGVGWTGLLVSLAWAAVAIVPVIFASIVSAAVAFSMLNSEIDAIGVGSTPPADPGVGAVVVIGVVIAVAAAFVIACLLLDRVGLARASVYLRATPGLPLHGQLDFIKLNALGFWKATGVTLLATLPASALEMAGSALREGRPALDTIALASWLLYVPAGFLTFCAAMISARAWGRWLREIDPRTLPPLDVELGSDRHYRPVEATPAPEPSDDPFSDAEDA